jgi:nicotinamide-nucleotide amidase
VLVAEVVNTGTELLLGNVINTHLAFLAKELFPLGIRITRQCTVPDGIEIGNALAEAASRSPDIVFVTGGLGPTSDDLTRDELARLLGLELVCDESVLAAIHELCVRRRIAFRESMARQALVPKGARVLSNPHGTAPGLYVPASPSAGRRAPHWFLLPGPPRELQPMFFNEVLPLLRELFPDMQGFSSRTYRVTGMGETAVEEAIGARIESEGILEVGFCARPNAVDLRLIGPREALERWHPHILQALGSNIFGFDQDSLESVVVRELTKRGQTLATAESCTGGYLANLVTNVPGASAVFLEGHVTYSNESKIRTLGVSAELLEKFGAVSAETARAMAEGLLERTGATHAVTTTGIAGPGGGSPGKPVGLVFIGYARIGCSATASEHHFPVDRETFKRLASQAALDTVRRALLENSNAQA